ncbi:MAG: hypothetical protein V1493_00385 [Candidatus Diapherotrites archaeon]
MWLITSFIAAIIATAAWAFAPKKYRLDFLALMLWGLATMVLVDHLMGFEGGQFIKMETDGLIANGTVLGIAMLMPILIIWEIRIVIAKLKGEITTG